MNANTSDRPRLQPLVALRALRRLLNDPEDTHQVFVIIRALSGDALTRGLARFRTLDVGRRVLAEEIDLIDTLKDRPALAALQRGTLGREYFEFTKSEHITADGLVDASAPSHGEALADDPELARYAARTRDMHDLWHTVTQYGRDELGETCLLAFTYAQTRNRGVGVMAIAGALKLRRVLGRGVIRAVWRGYRAGRRAAWLPGQDWEAMLSRSLDAVRRELGIDRPIAYDQVRFELRTTG